MFMARIVVVEIIRAVIAAQAFALAWARAGCTARITVFAYPLRQFFVLINI